MNLLVIFISGLVVANAIPASERHLRDVSHLNLSYLPPHLPRLKEYLPPMKSQQLPTLRSKEYLPPSSDVSIGTVAGTSQPVNEYLPPASVTKVVTTKPSTLPTNEYLPPISAFGHISVLSLEPVTESNENIEVITQAANHTILEDSSGEEVVALNVMPQDTAIMDVDGYHYKKPANIPDLFLPQESKTEYLPPLTNGIVKVEYPKQDESTGFKNEGYYYRTIRRNF